MNLYQVVGYIALGFGFILFLNALYVGLNLPSILQSQRFTVMLPWLDETAFSWIIAIVTMIAGSKKKNVQTKL